MRPAALFALLCSFSLIAACNPAENIAEDIMEDALEQEAGDNADVDIGADGRVRVETDEGTYETGAQSVPSDWPSDAPVYPGATVVSSATVNPKTGEPGAMLVLSTKDSADDVEAFYTAQIAANGWTSDGSMKSGGLVIIAAKKDGRVLSLMITGAEGQTSITLGLGEE